jgi:8-oxo-dGTP pyrophosphatase MutT (NUDIX family)
MKANLVETFIAESGEIIKGERKSVKLPFSRVSARAIIVRQEDGAILGTLHRKNGMYALPGGAIDDNEHAEDAILRELEEENISLKDSDKSWRERVSVDYYGGYKELTVWYLFVVANAEIQPCEENIETRWISQDEDVWYPFIREKILLAINTLMPELAKRSLTLD